jgi:hypothetical protein
MNLAVTVRPRSLANVLLDLKEAIRDWRDAVDSDDPDADDRATEAETRLEDLREEFAAKLVDCTGLTAEQMRDAYAEALI